jgi:K+-sensing histidine kinase KdpD
MSLAVLVDFGHRLFDRLLHAERVGALICATIIKAHRGELTLVNDEIGGPVAILTLPAQEALLTDEILLAAK